eukprot:3898991-Amphidinium_carterae.1
MSLRKALDSLHVIDYVAEARPHYCDIRMVWRQEAQHAASSPCYEEPSLLLSTTQESRFCTMPTTIMTY